VGDAVFDPDSASLPARDRVDDRDELITHFDELLWLDLNLVERLGELLEVF
jgi:hypothetical protein